MERKRVESSVIAAVGHDEHHNVLEVEFRSGKIYDYFMVTRAVHDELVTAPSVGQYFNRVIRPNYRGVLVRHPDMRVAGGSKRRTGRAR